MSHELGLFRAYAMTMSMTPEAAIEFDAWRHPSNPAEGFDIWYRARIAEFMASKPDAFEDGNLVDDEQFGVYCRLFALCAGVTWGRA